MPSFNWIVLIAAIVATGAYLLRDGTPEWKNRDLKELIRKRDDFETAEDWMLSAKQKKVSRFDLEGTLISTISAAETETWDAAKPPMLRIDGDSHFNNILGRKITTFVFQDLLIRPEPIDIKATPDQVWEVLMDVDKFHAWNPFHERVDVIEQEDGTILYSMHVNMGGMIGKIVSKEEIFYVDSKRHIVCYGIGMGVPSSMRVFYITPKNNGGESTFHSYDLIGGYPGLFSRGYIASLVYHGFTNQHQALKKRVESLYSNES